MKLRAYFMLRTLKHWKKIDNSQQTSIKPFRATGSFTILLFFWCFQRVYRKKPMAWTGFNPFVSNTLFPYFLKTSENLMVFYALGRRESVHWECMGNVVFYLLLPHNHPILGLPTFSPFQSFYVANHCTPIYDGLDIMPRVVKKSHPLHLFYEYLSLLP